MFSFLAYSLDQWIGAFFFLFVPAAIGFGLGRLVGRRAARISGGAVFLALFAIFEWELVSRDLAAAQGFRAEDGAKLAEFAVRTLAAGAAGAAMGYAFRAVRAARRAAVSLGVLVGAAFGAAAFVLGLVLGSVLAPTTDPMAVALFFVTTYAVARVTAPPERSPAPP